MKVHKIHAHISISAYLTVATVKDLRPLKHQNTTYVCIYVQINRTAYIEIKTAFANKLGTVLESYVGVVPPWMENHHYHQN